MEAWRSVTSKTANRKLRHYVESHRHAVRQKAEIMVDQQYRDNPAFKRWLADTIFSVTYNPPAA